MGVPRSKEDDVQQISTSIFVTNFPEQFTARDLWNTCTQYGNVIDAFIPNRRSKSGHRFGFVRFIKIKDIDRLVNNLCTVWVGRLRIHANIARFQRSPMSKASIQSKPNVAKETLPGGVQTKAGMNQHSNSYVYVAKSGHQSQSVENDSKPALVLDDSCTFKGDLSLPVFGKLKEFSSLTNIKTLLASEGFDDIVIQLWEVFGCYL
ncbi:nucleotide-binding alpha-beta plait domain-containing protein, partial [Tanacetum coccineum]